MENDFLLSGGAVDRYQGIWFPLWKWHLFSPFLLHNRKLHSVFLPRAAVVSRWEASQEAKNPKLRQIGNDFPWPLQYSRRHPTHVGNRVPPTCHLPYPSISGDAHVCILLPLRLNAKTRDLHSANGPHMCIYLWSGWMLNLDSLFLQLFCTCISGPELVALDSIEARKLKTKVPSCWS